MRGAVPKYITSAFIIEEGADAQIIGEISDGGGVVLNTTLGGQRKISVLRGEGLPRIC